MRNVLTMSALLVAATAVGAEVRALGAAEADGKAPVVAVVSARIIQSSQKARPAVPAAAAANSSRSHWLRL